MKLANITPLILTYNEAPNITRSLSRLTWAQEVVVVDSGSDDDTVSLARAFPNVRVIERAFDNHANQWNHGLRETAIANPWILALDADYLVTDQFLEEVRELDEKPGISAYQVPFTYAVYGRPLRGSCYGPVATLFRRMEVEYRQDGHTQRLHLQHGAYGSLQSRLIHDDRKPLTRWLTNQIKYMDLEAHNLLSKPSSELSRADRLRLTVVGAPLIMPAYCLIVQQGLLDGWAGWFYAMQRTTAELILSLKLLEHRLHQPVSGL